MAILPYFVSMHSQDLKIDSCGPVLQISILDIRQSILNMIEA